MRSTNFYKIINLFGLLLAFTFYGESNLYAQNKRANIWYFGDLGGLDFNSGTAAPLTNGALNSFEGCATICDDNGDLLFYTNGIDVYNKQHIVMTNGSGLFGGQSATQSALIVPMPGSNVLYYIFTVEQAAGPNGFCYSIVDMNLDNGNGGITSKNVTVLNSVPLSEKLAGTMHTNGQDIWVCVRGNLTTYIYTFLVTPTGINPPVISSGGTFASVSANYIGYMKFSHSGAKLASAAYSESKIDLFDFNNTTGVLSNVSTYNMPLGQFPYGIEFSPHDSRLYVTAGISGGYNIYQMDMSLPTNAAILASATSVNFRQDVIYGIQAAFDGKIYISYFQNNWIGTITDPELLGSMCNVIDSALFLGSGHRTLLGLPNYISNYLYVTGTDELAENSNSPIQIYPNPGSGVFSFSGVQGTMKIFSATGKLIYTKEITEEDQVIDISGYSKGVYMLSFQTQHSTHSSRLVIAH